MEPKCVVSVISRENLVPSFWGRFTRKGQFDELQQDGFDDGRDVSRSTVSRFEECGSRKCHRQLSRWTMGVWQRRSKHELPVARIERLQPPTVLTPNPSAGIFLTPGDILTISYVSGTWTNAPGNPFWDAGGDPAVVFTSPANAHLTQAAYFLAHYFPTTDFPYNGYDLDGVFTNSVGSIIGDPFPIGDHRTVIVPQGATQLQLGMDDTYYGDNSGSVTMSVTESAATAAPEPSSLALFGLGSLGLLVYGWRRRK